MNTPTDLPSSRRQRRTVRPLEAVGPTHLSLLVVAARKAADLTQNALATKMNRSQPWICGIENGSVWDLSVSQIVAVAEALDVPTLAVYDAVMKTHTDLRSQLQVPEEGSGQALVVTAGELVVRPAAGNSDPTYVALTRKERAVAAVGEFAPKRPLDPSTRWAGVESIPIHIDDLPDADSLGHEESPG